MSPMNDSAIANLGRGVVIVSHEASRTGAPLIALNIARELRETRGIPIVTILLRPGALKAQFARLGPVFVAPVDPSLLQRLDLETYFGPYASGRMARYAVRTATLVLQPCQDLFWHRVLRHLARQGITHAICNSASSGPAAARLKRAGFASIGLVHELPYAIRIHKSGRRAAALVEGADALVFPCATVEEAFTGIFAITGKPSFVLPQGFNIDPTRLTGQRSATVRSDLRARLGLGLDDILVLGCGYGDFRKGVDLFVQTARETALTSPKVTSGKLVFVWAGAVDPPFRGWAEKDAIQLGIGLVFVGPQQDMALWYAAADIFFLSSREDAFPNVVLEAMANGLPVVGFAGSGGFEEQIGEGGGVAVPYGNTAVAAKTLRQIAGDPAERERIGRLGREATLRLGGYRKYVDGLVDALAAITPATDR